MNRTYLNFATMRMSYVLLMLTSRGTLHQVMITYLSTALHCRKGYLNVHYNKIAMRLKMYAQCSGYSEWIYKMNIQAILLDLALVFTLSSTQNIYDGCSADKDCLGFMKGMARNVLKVPRKEMLWPSKINHWAWIYDGSRTQKCNFHPNPITSNFHSLST